MSTELHLTDDESARLDLLLSQYLQAHPIAPYRIVCPPWRDQGRQPLKHDHAAFNKIDDPWSDSSAYGAVRSIRSE